MQRQVVFPIALNIVAFVLTLEEELGGLGESWTSTGKRSYLVIDFAGFEETVRKVIGLMDEMPSILILNDQEPLEQWFWASRKVMLMGRCGSRHVAKSTAVRLGILWLTCIQEPEPAKQSKTATCRPLHECLSSRGSDQK